MIEIIAAHLALIFLIVGLIAWWRAIALYQQAMSVHVHNLRMLDGFHEAVSLYRYGAEDEANQLMLELAGHEVVKDEQP